MATQWNCPKCTFENAPSEPACTLCGYIKPNEDGWKCLNCTFVNISPNLVACQICQNPKPYPPFASDSSISSVPTESSIANSPLSTSSLLHNGSSHHLKHS